MIKAILFDCGGVLINSVFDGMIAYCSEALHIEKRSLLESYRKYEDAFQKGQVAEEDLWTRILEDNQLEMNDSRLLKIWGDAFSAVYRINDFMFDLVSRVKQKKLKTGVLSNTEKAVAARFQSGIGSKIELFDYQYYSCDIGLRKPSEEIYRYVQQNMQLEMEQIAFIDDVEENIEAANRLGMHGILYLSDEGLIRSLRKLDLI